MSLFWFILFFAAMQTGTSTLYTNKNQSPRFQQSTFLAAVAWLEIEFRNFVSTVRTLYYYTKKVESGLTMSKPTRIKCKLPLGKILPLALLLCVCTDTILYTLYYSGSESIQCADIISISPIDKRNTRPIWLPSHPTTLDENLHSEMITILTGKTQGAKQLEHNIQCYPYGVTVTCSIKLSNTNSPDTFSDKFFNQYIMAIRNPITLFPAHLNDKGIKFHGLVGQLSEDNWLKARDEHFHSFIEDWSKVITVWKSMSYTKGMYLVTEELMEMQEGVEALQ